MFPVIERIEVIAKFRYLWLKYVDSVNLDVHCAKCLVGEYSQKIKNTTKNEFDISLDEQIPKYYYLCGVSQPYKWENNFHLPFKFSQGKVLSVVEKGISIRIYNAERILFNTLPMIKKSHPNISKKEFHSCRNWIFANMIAGECNG